MQKNCATYISNFLKLITGSVCLVITLIYYCFKQQEIYSVKNEQFLKTPSVKYILYYYPMGSALDLHMGTEEAPFQHCAFSNCYVTFNNSFMPIDKWDAIIFPMKTNFQWRKPMKRHSRQKYIFYNMEAPTQFASSNWNELMDFFNWTMSYRKDSDVLRPHGYFVKEKTSYQLPRIENLVKRLYKIAWYIYRCDAYTGSDLLAWAINRYISVDVYGKCGGAFGCKNESLFDEDCRELLEKNYKFYLGFEDSLCSDFLSGRTWSVLNNNIIPIVYSGANLTQQLPPYSFINVQDFSSIDELVKYLMFLDENPQEYLKYFRWKQDYVIKKGKYLGMCNLCEKLNGNEDISVYHNITEWWVGKNSADKFDCNKSFINKY